MTVVRVFLSRVVSVTEEIAKLNYREVKNRDGTSHWINDAASLGWFVRLDGSHEKLFVGVDKPEDLAVGDVVRVTVQKVEPPQ